MKIVDQVQKKRFVSIFHMLAILFYCFCGGEFYTKRRNKQCNDNGTTVVLKWRCKLCSYEIISDHMGDEPDWEGLQ